jgi:hypothetical protein
MIKAIGKGSLATILAVGLHIVRVIVWIGLVGLTVGLVIAPLLPFLVEWASKTEGVNFDNELDIGADDIVSLLYHFITFGVILYVIERLLELLRTLRLGSPFVKENADRFKHVGFALLFGEAAKIVIGIAAVIFDADVDMDIELITFLSIAAVFVLAEVFSEGARMKEEQDLTV